MTFAGCNERSTWVTGASISFLWALLYIFRTPLTLVFLLPDVEFLPKLDRQRANGLSGCFRRQVSIVLVVLLRLLRYYVLLQCCPLELYGFHGHCINHMLWYGIKAFGFSGWVRTSSRPAPQHMSEFRMGNNHSPALCATLALVH